MTRLINDRLYDLLPAIYRTRDKEHGEALEALLDLIYDEMKFLKKDIDGLYEDWFIETCSDWVIPYIGDLLGCHGAHALTDDVGASRRGYVANTIAYRRRKGTASVLEQVSRDVTGWPAHAVEFFQLLALTQNLNHLRLDRARTACIRDADEIELVNGPFESTAHTPDIRRIETSGGRYNIPNVGIFLWRLQSYPLSQISARKIGVVGNRYTFDPTGLEIPLFNRPQTEDKIVHLSGEINIPGPLRRYPLYNELEVRRKGIYLQPSYFDPLPVFAIDILFEGEPDRIPPEDIFICNLPDWHDPPALDGQASEAGDESRHIHVAIDPVRGKLVLPAEIPIEDVLVSYSYGFSADVGAGPYDRTSSIRKMLKEDVDWQMGVSKNLEGGKISKTIGEALDSWDSILSFRWKEVPGLDEKELIEILVQKFAVDWVKDAEFEKADDGLAIYSSAGEEYLSIKLDDKKNEAILKINDSSAGVFEAKIENDELLVYSGIKVGLITVMDSHTYEEDLRATIPRGCKLLVIGADWPDQTLIGQFSARDIRPHLQGDIEIDVLKGTASNMESDRGELIIDGFLIEGKLKATSGSILLQFAHTTLFPDTEGIVIENASSAELIINRSICGPISIAGSASSLVLKESIIDSDNKAVNAIAAERVDAQIDRCTVLGKSHLRRLEASNSIFTGDVTVAQRQEGCVRYSSLTVNSKAPKRFRCQPDLAVAEAKETLKRDLSDEEKGNIRARLTPLFTSVHYGDPGYAQLSRSCAEEIKTGAEDGSEMGVFGILKQPQREANLRAALEEYLRFGLEAGIFYMT